MEQIKNKQINKSIEWKNSKNTHGQGAMHRLLYKCWTHTLQNDGAPLASHPKFSSYSTIGNTKYIFTSK